jgi:glycine cleavage system regulatory protein
MVEPTQRWTRPSAIDMATINVMGNDAPGIVKEVTSAVASQGIDILTVESEVLSAPFSGAEMFQLQMVRLFPLSLSSLLL